MRISRAQMQLSELLGSSYASKQKQDCFALRNIRLKTIHRLKTFFGSTERKRKFEEDYPSFLLALGSSLRTGLDPFAGMIAVEKLLPDASLLKKEIRSFHKLLHSGMPEEDALFSFGISINHPDIKLFSMALLLARRQGSSLGPCLQRLNIFTRQRQAFRRKAKASIAMQRLSSYGIVGCSLIIGIMQVSANYESFLLALHHPLGRMLLSSGSLLLGIGLSWMLYLGRARI